MICDKRCDYLARSKTHYMRVEMVKAKPGRYQNIFDFLNPHALLRSKNIKTGIILYYIILRSKNIKTAQMVGAFTQPGP